MNDVPKAHELQLAPGRNTRMILMDLAGSRHGPLRGRRMLVWLRLELFSYAISIALAHPVSSVCHTMKCERNGNQ